MTNWLERAGVKQNVFRPAAAVAAVRTPTSALAALQVKISRITEPSNDSIGSVLIKGVLPLSLCSSCEIPIPLSESAAIAAKRAYRIMAGEPGFHT